MKTDHLKIMFKTTSFILPISCYGKSLITRKILKVENENDKYIEKIIKANYSGTCGFAASTSHLLRD